MKRSDSDTHGRLGREVRLSRQLSVATFVAAMPDQVALSYSKFDHIVDSDDEDNESKARDALLIDKKQRHHR